MLNIYVFFPFFFFQKSFFKTTLRCITITNEAPRLSVCVRQSSVTKQQAWTRPGGSIIENTQPQTHTHLHTHTHIISKSTSSSNISVDIIVISVCEE